MLMWCDVVDIGADISCVFSLPSTFLRLLPTVIYDSAYWPRTVCGSGSLCEVLRPAGPKSGRLIGKFILPGPFRYELRAEFGNSWYR